MTKKTWCALTSAVCGVAICGAAGAVGPDVILSDVQSLSNHGGVGAIHAYSIGSHTCNIGNQNLQWASNGTPGLAMNAYRLSDGRLVQIGQSFAKTACCAAAGNGCGLGCNGAGGSQLGAGCLDVYSSGWNSGQTRLGPRSTINGFTGFFSGFSGSSGNAIYRRLQVPDSESAPAHPGALFFIEGEYVGTDDASFGNAMNNASHKRVNIDGNYNMSLVGPIRQMVPAIYAWRENGNGVGVPDNTVEIVNVDVPGEGRFIAAAKATDLGNGTWRYDYAVMNFNSDRSGGSFSVPVPAGAMVTDVGFHDVDCHSGEPFDNTDWSASVGGGAITWSSPQTFAQNANSNAIRWGTMYNFWFTSNASPDASTATLGLFKPGTPTSMAYTAVGPTGLGQLGDLDGDGHVGPGDLAIVLGAWGTAAADLDGDGTTGAGDLAIVLGAWGS